MRIGFDAAESKGIEVVETDGVAVAVASKPLLIETKQTVLPSDAADVEFIGLRMAEEGVD